MVALITLIIAMLIHYRIHKRRQAELEEAKGGDNDIEQL